VATKYDIVIPQGGIWRLVVDVVGGPSSLAGWGAQMQVRKTKGGAQVLADLPPAAFSVDPDTRQLLIELNNDYTSTYDWSGPAVYDLYLVGPEPNKDRWRLLEGSARLSQTVTKENP
jgi:hypothetical protein